MSLPRSLTFWSAIRFPRVSGDEPVGDLESTDDRQFSPRERG